jgi:hypothetical protein
MYINGTWSDSYEDSAGELRSCIPVKETPMAISVNNQRYIELNYVRFTINVTFVTNWFFTVPNTGLCGFN